MSTSAPYCPYPWHLFTALSLLPDHSWTPFPTPPYHLSDASSPTLSQSGPWHWMLKTQASILPTPSDPHHGQTFEVLHLNTQSFNIYYSHLNN